MIPLREARQLVLGSCPRLPPRVLAVAEALGCVVAEGVVSEVEIPPFANSQMDGYAVRAAETAGAPVTLPVDGSTLAGMAPGPALAPGTARRIMTGAPLPEGADAVVMVERTRPGPTSGEVVVEEAVLPGTFVRPPGGDVRIGQEVIPAGTVIRAGQIGVLASLGRRTVLVVGRPRVGVLSTGDELVLPPAPLGPGQIRDANRPALLAALSQAGADPVDLGLVPDDTAAITGAILRAAQRCDAVVVSGGVSVGDADLVSAALAGLCGDSVRWLQIAIRPAKPFAFGVTREDGIPVFGVPGNPVSALVSFELLVRPALRQMAGHSDLDRSVVAARAGEDLTRRPDGKTHFQRVLLGVGEDGGVIATGSGPQESHVLQAMARAEGLAVLPDGEGARAGETVAVMVLDPEGLAARTPSGIGVPW